MTTQTDENPASPDLQPATVQRYRIEHVTEYTYPQPVMLDQLILRLQPRTGPVQRLIDFTIDMDPAPSRQTHGIDLHGNIRHWFWFHQRHEHLTITTRSTVDCRIENPFDYIIVDPGVQRIPVTYSEPIRNASAHYRHRTDTDPALDTLASQVIDACDGTTLNFLWMLVLRLHQELKHVVRPTGEAWTPGNTWRTKEGACRDEALLFVEICRVVGLAARFVSGYAWDAIDDDRREMHAWAEVYIPGGGWRGYDTSIGKAVSNSHIAVAASPSATYAAPVTGTFSGPVKGSKLDFSISMVQEAITLHNEGNITFRWA